MPGLDHRTFLAQDYALINPMQTALDQRSDLDVAALVPAGMDRHARLMPLLASLRDLPEHRRLELLERSDRWARNYDMPLFTALLASKADPNAVKAHLLRNMTLRRGKAGAVWLRLHDPRVLRHLRWILSPQQMACLMGPIASWTWYDPLAGEWHVHECPERDGRWSVSPTPDQWKALEMLEGLNRCLRDVAESAGSPPDDDVARELLHGLHEARAVGLADEEDACFYAKQRLEFGPGCRQREEVRQCLENMRTCGTSYVGVNAAMQLAPVSGDWSDLDKE